MKQCLHPWCGVDGKRCVECTQAQPSQSEAIVHTAEMLEAVRLFLEARSRAHEVVAKTFPIGSEVKVTSSGGHAIRATVHAYVADSPELVSILFENGNVWAKRVEQLTPIV